jgi:transposase
MAPHCLGKVTDPGRSGANNRLFVEAALWIACTGSPWRDLLASFSKWNSVYVRFRDRMKADAFKQLFDAVSDDPDMEYAMVDATIVKVHRHGQGAKGGPAAMTAASFAPQVPQSRLLNHEHGVRYRECFPRSFC